MAFSVANVSCQIPSTVPLTDRCDGIITRFCCHLFPPLKTTSGSILSLQIANRPVTTHLRSAACSAANIAEDDVLMFEKYLESNKKRMDAELEMAIPLRYPSRLHESMRHTLMSSRKRLLSAVCMASCQAIGGDESRAMPVACAVEMITAMVLIHDDLPCMDNADLRLGKIANHKAFDEATALLAGDALLCLAFEHLARHADSMSPQQFVQVVLELGSGCGLMLGGQMMDKLWEARDDVGLAELELVHMHKAGKPIGAAVACGAIMGGGNGDEVEKLKRFGTKIGFLLQVVDDILDATKTREETGKSVGNDSVNGKLTYVKLMGVEGAKKCADQLLDDALLELSCFDPEKAALLRRTAIYFHNMQI